MLEESRGFLSSFMVRCFTSGGGLPRSLVPPLFADVIESINGRRDPLPAAR